MRGGKQWRRRESRFRFSIGRWRLPVIIVLIIIGIGLWIAAMINMARLNP